MNSCVFDFANTTLHALPTGALHWPDHNLLVVSDLHLGKSGRLAPHGGAQLPPYEMIETLQKLQDDLDATQARNVICLGDSFDSPVLGRALPEQAKLWITRLQAGRDWVWIEGNHDPGPVGLGGAHLGETTIGPLTFRHIAQSGAQGEVSGHYHPKAPIRTRARTITRPCFLFDTNRLVLPAYGAFTGGLRTDDPALRDLMDADACVILTGPTPCKLAMPR